MIWVLGFSAAQINNNVLDVFPSHLLGRFNGRADGRFNTFDINNRTRPHAMGNLMTKTNHTRLFTRTRITIGNQTAGGIRQTWYPYTHPFNMTGHPAITVPCGIMADGLPAGLQIVGPMMADAGIIHLAAMVERAHPWAHLWPDGV